MNKLVQREVYLNQLIEWKDHKVIKVITGMRRSGKSTLLINLYKDYLLSQNIDENQIIIVDLESIDNEHLYDYRLLYEHISEKLISDKMNYVIIDEVQNAEFFQKAVDSLYIKENVDVYITGSNAKVLSGELATLLSGRYVTIEVLPLSFREFKSVSTVGKTNEEIYREYIRWGGMPYITKLGSDFIKEDYLQGVYNTVLKKDIISKNKINDVFVLEDVIKFVFDNIGNILSSNKISNTLTSNGRKISRATVDKYLSYLVDSFIIYKINRYDIKGKEYLKSLEKYYTVDTGLRNNLLGFKNIDRGRILENIVYLELRRRGYKIYIGKYENYEVDFIIQKSNKTMYVQVSETIRDEDTLAREIRPLKEIDDFYPRIILTADYDLNTDYDGIKVFNVYDWLLNDEDVF